MGEGRRRGIVLAWTVLHRGHLLPVMGAQFPEKDSHFGRLSRGNKTDTPYHLAALLSFTLVLNNDTVSVHDHFNDITSILADTSFLTIN